MNSSALVSVPGHPFSSIGIMGAGAWGSALAVCALAAGRTVRMWVREPELAASLATGGGNPTFLPGVPLPPLDASTDMGVLADVDAILAVTPTQHLRSALRALAPHVGSRRPIALCAKGIEQVTLALPTEILAAEIPNADPAVLSGPSFAADVARGLPTAVTLACPDREQGQRWMATVGRPHFRMYASDDLVGAEAGGAVKNVLAIACGVVEGMGLGRSAHAALIARGFAEMTRFGVALGGRAETLAGLCGLGDLVLTCSSPQSRNMSFGIALGQGRTPAEILAGRNSVTEGVESAPAVAMLAARHGVEMPICLAVADLVAGTTRPKDAMDRLLSRPFREEG